MGRRQLGFTLIEMLVVMMIIGVTLAMVSVNFSRDERALLETEAQRLALLFEQARDEAMISARAFAWSSEAGGYRFWQRNLDAKWAVAEDDLFRPRGLTAPVKVANLSINEAKALLNERIVFSPSGFNAPFALVLTAGKERATVGSDAGGRISIRLADANR